MFCYHSSPYGAHASVDNMVVKISNLDSTGLICSRMCGHMSLLVINVNETIVFPEGMRCP